MGDWHARYIVDAWNNVENRGFAMIAQDAANMLKAEVGDEDKATTWALLIRKQDYQFN